MAVDSAHGDDGKLLADVTYRLTDDRGKSVEARARYPVGGYHLQKLFDALVEAGLPEGSPLADAVGIEERVTIMYPYEGALGKIKSRSPVSAVQTAQAKPVKSGRPLPRVLTDDDQDDDHEDDPDEFDDFLEDEIED